MAVLLVAGIFVLFPVAKVHIGVAKANQITEEDGGADDHPGKGVHVSDLVYTVKARVQGDQGPRGQG